MTKLKKYNGMDDEKYIKNYGHWVSWPYCPLKRRDRSMADKNLGVLLCTQEFETALRGSGKIVVFHVNMFAPPKGKDAWDASPKTEYDSLQALLVDGWEVD